MVLLGIASRTIIKCEENSYVVHTLMSFVKHANKARYFAPHKNDNDLLSHHRLLQHFLQYLDLLKNRALAGASSGILKLYSALVVQAFHNIIS
jgi:hypothetical protein